MYISLISNYQIFSCVSSWFWNPFSITLFLTFKKWNTEVNHQHSWGPKLLLNVQIPRLETASITDFMELLYEKCIRYKYVITHMRCHLSQNRGRRSLAKTFLALKLGNLARYKEIKCIMTLSLTAVLCFKSFHGTLLAFFWYNDMVILPQIRSRIFLTPIRRRSYNTTLVNLRYHLLNKIQWF